MGFSCSSKPIQQNFGWDTAGLWMGFGWAFPADGVVPSSARETFESRWHRVILGRLGRFVFRKPGAKPKGHVICYQSHVVWPHRAVVGANPIDLLEV